MDRPIRRCTCGRCKMHAKEMGKGEEVRVRDPDTGGEKCSKPCRMDLIPPKVLEEEGNVYGYGATKYDDNNWAKGYKWSLSIAALMRHLTAWVGGEDRDPESGCHHLAHVRWHCGTLQEFQRMVLGKDDRLVSELEVNRMAASIKLSAAEVEARQDRRARREAMSPPW